MRTCSNQEKLAGGFYRRYSAAEDFLHTDACTRSLQKLFAAVDFEHLYGHGTSN